jgi:hypothetical protein
MDKEETKSINFFEQRRKSKEEITTAEKEYSLFLLSKAPEKLRSWLEEDKIIENIIEYEACSRRIRPSDEYFKMRSKKQVVDLLTLLKNAWEDLSEIEVLIISTKGDEKVIFEIIVKKDI